MKRTPRPRQASEKSHVIRDDTGIKLRRTYLKFTGGTVTDDVDLDATVVTVGGGGGDSFLVGQVFSRERFPSGDNKREDGWLVGQVFS